MHDPLTLDVVGLRKKLLQRRAELREIAGTARASLATVELDQSRVGRLSRMDALQMQAMAQEEAGRRERELIRIDQALQRVETEDFGFCVTCDEPIAPKRLALDPAVTICILCAAAAESGRTAAGG